MIVCRWHRWLIVTLGSIALLGAACGSCDENSGGGLSDGADSGADVRADAADVADTHEDTGADTGRDVGCEETCADTCCAEGEECVEDQCLEACPGTRCGESSQLCCTGDEVCIFEGCYVPGDDCSHSFECPEDEYCEETLGQCLPRDAADDSCTYRPEPGDFSPDEPAHFEGVEHDGRLYDKSFTTPAVADIDSDGLPEIVALLYYGSMEEALLAVIDGETMDLVAYGGVGRVRTNSAGLAVGQLDEQTEELEIVAHQSGGGLVAFRYDAGDEELEEWWSNEEGPLGSIENEGAPSIADLDGDGSPEVFLGFSVVDAEGNIWNGLNEGSAGGHGSHGVATAAVDLDEESGDAGERHLEVVAGNRAMKTDGSLLWDVSSDVPDGYPAVGDMTGDGSPEVVNVAGGDVYVLSGVDGSLLFGPTPIPGGGQGGPPTIADFDGDDNPEFAAAGQGRYTVYDLDCVGDSPDPSLCDSERGDGILWSTEVQDLSSSRTGSSVFDFEGDGRAEVVYNDECFLRVYDGVDGTILFERANTTRTGSEYPIIVDVDADFNAEIVVVSNNDQIERDECEDNYDNYPAGGTTGVFAYSDVDNNWVPTRSIWNEHTYHITNVDDDGSIPDQEPIHYGSSITNTFRLNVQPDGLFDAPDLVVESLAIAEGVCGDEIEAIVEVTVENAGSQGVGPGVEVEVRATIDGDTSVIGTVETTDRLLPGQTETLSIAWRVPDGALDGDLSLEATVDTAEEINECVEDNNESTYEPSDDELEFPALVVRSLDVSDGGCGVDGSIDFDATVANEGSDTVAEDVPVRLEALRGNTSETIDTLHTSTPLDPGETETFQLTWSANNGFFGRRFEVRATIDPDEEVDSCSSGESATEQVDCTPEG